MSKRGENTKKRGEIQQNGGDKSTNTKDELDIQNYSVSELEDLIEYVSDLLLAKKHPSQVIKKNSLVQDLKMCHSKIWFGSTRFANKRAKNLSKKYNVEYRVYDCPTCGGYHLTTKILETMEKK